MIFFFGIALERPTLIVIAGVLLLIVLASLLWMLRRRFKEEDVSAQPGPSSSNDERDRELKELGIMEIRPKEKKDEAETRKEAPEPAPPAAGDSVAAAEQDANGSLETSSHPALSEPDQEEEEQEEKEEAPANDQKRLPAPLEEEADETPPAPQAAENDEPSPPAPSTTSPEPPPAPVEGERELQTALVQPSVDLSQASGVLVPYLESLRAVLKARTVCLLRQEEIALEYEVEALVSEADNVLHEGTFSTSTPLLTASMSQRPVTVQRIGERALPAGSLGYYRGPVSNIRQIMLAPIEHAYEPASFFLLADTVQEGGFNADRPRALMREYASLLSRILAEEELEALQHQTDTRPRREIIAEEMERAQRQDHPLALAFIYLNRAEALADEGERALASAEQKLERYLREKTPKGRVERFGELTYGVFYPSDVSEVETWAMQLQNEMEKRGGQLEGGISIGIAMLSDRHDAPDALRADATEALREAYETGTCTILE